MPLNAIANRLALVFLLSGTCLTARSQVLEREEAWFRANPNSRLRTEIGGKTVLNDFPLYNRIVGSSKGRPMGGFRLEETSRDQPFDFYGVHFSERVGMNRVDFKESVDVSLAEFDRSVQLQTTRFMGSFLANWSAFRSDALFSRVEFERESQFMRAVFDSTANFKFCRFGKIAFFFGCFFRKGVSFNDSRFDSNSLFSFSSFSRRASFQRAEFDSVARFNNTVFEDGAEFLNATFDSLADFANAKVRGRLDFTGTALPLYFDFSGMQEIDGFVDLMRVETSMAVSECRINLLNSDISKFLLTYDDFRLYFPQNTAFSDKVKVYEDLLENFKTRELEDSYKKLDIEFNQFKYREKRENAANFVQKIWWNYGYDKNMIFVWILRILLFFTIINTFFIRRLLTAISELPFLTRKTVEKHHLHHPIIAYFLNFPGTFLYTLILILSGSSGLSIIKDHTKIPNVVWMLYMIVLSLIGLSLSLFIFNYIIN